MESKELAKSYEKVKEINLELAEKGLFVDEEALDKYITYLTAFPIYK